MKILAHVMTSTAKMPMSVKSNKYMHVALVLIDVDELAGLGRDAPAMISERARGIVQIIEEHDRLHVGRTARSEGRCILNDLYTRAAAINANLDGEEPA